MRNKWKKKTLYIASFLKDDMDEYGNIVPTYDTPIFIGLQNIQPLSGSADVEEFGTKVSKMQRVLLDWTMLADNNITVRTIDNMIILNLDKLTIQDLTNRYKTVDMPIKENDLAYLDGATPENEKNNGDNANYRVDSIRKQNRKIAIYFEKLPNK